MGDRPGNNDIWVVSSAGGAAWNITADPANEGWARWSPDGRKVVERRRIICLSPLKYAASLA